MFGLQEAVGAELVIVEESSQKSHDFCVVLFLHGDEQDSAFNDAEVLKIIWGSTLRKGASLWIWLMSSTTSSSKI